MKKFTKYLEEIFPFFNEKIAIFRYHVWQKCISGKKIKTHFVFLDLQNFSCSLQTISINSFGNAYNHYDLVLKLSFIYKLLLPKE